jgi:hypothetical protein
MGNDPEVDDDCCCRASRPPDQPRWPTRRRNELSIFKLEANKAHIILALRGLSSAGMNEFMLTPYASREEIERKLLLLLGRQITDRWREYLCFKSRG